MSTLYIDLKLINYWRNWPYTCRFYTRQSPKFDRIFVGVSQYLNTTPYEPGSHQLHSKAAEMANYRL
jgi:hypothetical protein